MRNRSILLYLMIFSYSLSLPLESRQRLYITEASTLAGLYVLGSFRSEITDNRIVLFQNESSFVVSPRYFFTFTVINSKMQGMCFNICQEYLTFSFGSAIPTCDAHLTFCVGFHLSHGSSPLCGSSTGGCRIDMHRSPFYRTWTKSNYLDAPFIFR